MNTHTHPHSPTPDTPGYYLITIRSITGGRFLTSNDERAFIILQLQDMLNARSVLEEEYPHKRLAAHIDLLAFSIHQDDIRLVVCTIDIAPLQHLCRTLVDRLLQYQTEYRIIHAPVVRPTTLLVRLSGPHHALATTVNLHLRHTDWEYDRYSSIGFYLHDRRGSWMRLWRLAPLFDNNPGTYRLLLKSSLQSAHREVTEVTEATELTEAAESTGPTGLAESDAQEQADGAREPRAHARESQRPTPNFSSDSNDQSGSSSHT